MEVFHPRAAPCPPPRRRDRAGRGGPGPLGNRLTPARLQVAVPEAHPHRPVSPLLHPHRRASQPRTDLRPSDLVDPGVVPNRVIVGHHALLDVAQDRRQVVLRPQRSMRVGGILRFHREATIPHRQVLLLQISVGFFPGLHARLAQTLHQPVLGGAEESLDAPLRLRRVSGNPSHPQLLQSPPDLRPGLWPSLVRGLPHRTVHREHAVLVGVKFSRPSPPLQITLQQKKVLLRAVVLGKARQSAAGRVVDHRQQKELWPSSLQPVMFRRVPLHHLAPTGPARPPHVHLFHPPPLPLPYSRLHQNLPHALFAHHHPVLLPQILGRQCRPKVGVLPLHQPHHFRPHRRAQFPLRGPPSQPVQNPAVTLLPQPPHQLPHPALAQLQLSPRLLLRQVSLLCLVQDLQTIPLSCAHPQLLLFVHPDILPVSNRNFLLCSNRIFSLCCDSPLQTLWRGCKRECRRHPRRLSLLHFKTLALS